MRIYLNLLLITLIYVASGYLIQPPTPKLTKYNHYEVISPDKFQNFVLGGHSPGIGSSLAITSEESDTTKEFLSIADNGSFLISQEGDKIPFVGKISLAEGVANITAVIPLTGLSNKFDGEALALEEGARVWIADESKPSIIRYNLATGRPLATYSPGSGLPEILKNRMDNRGFEAIAFMPDKKIVFALQSPLKLSKEKQTVANYVRIMRLDPETQVIETFLYPIDQELYKTPLDLKLGGLAAINSHRALILEQGKTVDNKQINLIKEIDFIYAKGAKDSSIELEKQESFFSSPVLKPKLVLNLRDYGWTHNKAEGIALTAKGRTIYVINDIDTKIKSETDPDSDPLKVYLWEFRFSSPFRLSVFTDLAYRLAPAFLSLFSMMFLMRKRKSKFS
ncbi:MAG: esterase-like activity of phytase family protein [Bdellovibrionota bacterium]